MIDLPDWAAIVGWVVAGLIGFTGALAVLRSRYRIATDQEREKYIGALEARNTLLEEENARTRGEMKALEKEHHELRGQFRFLSQLVLGKCPLAEIDPDTGACIHCAMKLPCSTVPQQGGS